MTLAFAAAAGNNFELVAATFDISSHVTVQETDVIITLGAVARPAPTTSANATKIGRSTIPAG